MTYRERREARAARLEEWAAKRRVKAEQTGNTASGMLAAIPFGQPILVGHHSEQRDRNYRDRAWNMLGKSVEHTHKAESMESRAANISAALEVSIYSDDPDAIDALRARIADLEAKRARIVAYNASCRKGQRDLSLLDDEQKKDLESVAKYAPYQLRDGGAFPAYATSNISGRIKKDRDRLAELLR